MKLLAALLRLLILMCIPLGSVAQINTGQVMRIGKNALYFEDYVLSIQYFNLAIRSKPYLSEPYLMRAIAKLNLEDYRGAEEDATKAIELNRFTSDAYEVRGVARQNQGKTEEAIADYDLALEQLPDNKNILYNKALAYEDIGELFKAKSTFDKIIEAYPSNDNAYVGRAKSLLSMGDTIRARSDLDRALELNKNSANAYILRSNILAVTDRNFPAAIEDLNAAIKLLPLYSGLFINRAGLRYNVDDYFGAMADLDYAVTIDPLNPVAYFNRGVLRSEVSDYDNAIADFSEVLKIDPNDTRALYNRALVYRNTGYYREALADISRVVELMPGSSGPLFLRAEIYDLLGNKQHSMNDYDSAMNISDRELKALRDDAQRNVQIIDNQPTIADPNNGSSQHYAQAAPRNTRRDANADPESKTAPEEVFKNTFTKLISLDNTIDEQQQFNNKSIRGKVQDHNFTVELIPDFMLSYYTSPTELAPSSYFMKEIDNINSSHALRFNIELTNTQPQFDDEQMFDRHLKSIEYFNSYIATHTPRAIDFFGRAMDQFTLRNYEAAVADFSRALELAPDFTVAYFMRARANACILKTPAETPPGELRTTLDRDRALYKSILDDLDAAIELSPNSPFPYFNKGNLYMQMQDLTSAVAAYTKAIELKPDFGEAYYNRGYAYFRLGNRDAGAADLSRSGQLGIIQAYNLLKRINF